MRCKRKFMHGKRRRRSPIKQDEFVAVSESTSTARPAFDIKIVKKSDIEEYTSNQEKLLEQKKETSKVFDRTKEHLKRFGKGNALVNAIRNLTT